MLGMIHQLIYGSTAPKPFTGLELAELLRRAREKNGRLGVTGMLLYHDSSFLQILEGLRSDVETVYALIAQDKRHSGAVVYSRSDVAAREFPDWGMAFHAPTDGEIADLGGSFRQIRTMTAGDIQSRKARVFFHAFCKVTRI